MPRPFLTARWQNLIIASYAADPALLEPRLPPGTELDTRDGRAFVSVVAFEFRRTRLRGVAIPGHCNFPEVNLRFYVRRGDQRGVVFIRELVPRRAISWTARAFYNEPYKVAPIAARIEESRGRISAAYTIGGGSRPHRIAATGRTPGHIPAHDSIEHFFKEHEWGFGTTRRGSTLVYRVEHPHWTTYPVEESTIDVDWGELYGGEWGVLEGAEPVSIVLAAGSEVVVYPP